MKEAQLRADRLAPRRERTDEVVVEVDQLVKRYDRTAAPALAGISFRVHRGEVVGLLGPNGAGKTTTVEILNGFRSRTSGRVQLLGLDPEVPAQLRELRTRVGVVLQQTGHYRYLSARETVAMHRAYHSNPRSVDEVLALVGLEESADKRVRQLSGGQQRRLDVGVALVGRPEIIFLDEPTTGFDPAARRRAWDVIDELARLGTSVVLTTHYMEEASRLADRLVVLGEGGVVGHGTPDSLAKRLQLATVIRATLPYGIVPTDLPPAIRAGLVAPGRFELRAEEPTPVVGALCAWALDRGMRLEDLDVRAPSLEESYLALTEDSAAAEGDA